MALASIVESGLGLQRTLILLRGCFINKGLEVLTGRDRSHDGADLEGIQPDMKRLDMAVSYPCRRYGSIQRCSVRSVTCQ